MQKDDVLRLLGDIDRELEGKARLSLKVVGKCALLLSGMKDDIGTIDLDVVDREGLFSDQDHADFMHELKKKYGRESQLVNGYYLEFVDEGILFLPRQATWRRLEQDWKNLAVEYLDADDLVASKCFSYGCSKPTRKKDRTDVIRVLDQGLVGIERVLDAADDIFDAYSMDARAERFPEVYRFIQEELRENYGGRELRYRPRDE